MDNKEKTEVIVDSFFDSMGIKFYSKRHSYLVRVYVEAGKEARTEEHLKALLTQLGGWDSTDLKKAKEFFGID